MVIFDVLGVKLKPINLEYVVFYRVVIKDRGSGIFPSYFEVYPRLL